MRPRTAYATIKRSVMLVCILFSAAYSLFGQISKKDSLEKAIRSTKRSITFDNRDTVYINNLIELAFLYRYQDLDSMLYVSQESLKLSKQASFKNGQIESYRNIGNFHSDNGIFGKAISNFRKAYRLSVETQNSHSQVKALNDLATEYSYHGNYAMALKEYLNALDIAEKIDFQKYLSILNENIAHLYLSQKDYAQAMLFFKKVKTINEKIGNPIFIAETLSNMASAYADMNELDYAMFNINLSIAVI